MLRGLFVFVPCHNRQFHQRNCVENQRQCPIDFQANFFLDCKILYAYTNNICFDKRVKAICTFIL